MNVAFLGLELQTRVFNATKKQNIVDKGENLILNHEGVKKYHYKISGFKN